MLWSDRRSDEPDESHESDVPDAELRRALARMRRAGLLMAALLPLLMVLAAWRP
ncbi:hypothetical protein K7472_03880 [Streptomyces sp. PTM05]|uniref:Uncharacterized protein n=1 Tax=Streptantibioticus parmotrematis TaxID=2873249 RepID=A0ABS7QQ65_9ACTN|nr:hypothetical protein [Streptantibioticus parmotrematis]MBY8883982.1 hypothetical protein [Streptantibioticus parmotrematis]